MLRHSQETVRILGVGSSKEQAFSKAFAGIQKEVMNKYGKIMLRLEPVDVNVVSAKERVETEKFFFFFFPRQRSTYEVSLDVVMDVTYLDQEAISFEETAGDKGLLKKAYLSK